MRRERIVTRKSRCDITIFGECTFWAAWGLSGDKCPINSLDKYSRKHIKKSPVKWSLIVKFDCVYWGNCHMLYIWALPLIEFIEHLSPDKPHEIKNGHSPNMPMSYLLFLVRMRALRIYRSWWTFPSLFLGELPLIFEAKCPELANGFYIETNPLDLPTEGWPP